MFVGREMRSVSAASFNQSDPLGPPWGAKAHLPNFAKWCLHGKTGI